MGKIYFRFALLAAFAVPFVVGSCDTDYITMEPHGLYTDSSLVYLPYNGGTNNFRVTSWEEWWIEFEDDAATSWLTNISPVEGDFTADLTLSAATNNWRRRSVRLIFHNGYDTDTVSVIQRAPADYEPGTVIYYENFGADTVQVTTSIDNFTGWGARGSGLSVTSYTGSNAFIQEKLRTDSYRRSPHEDISGGNTLELLPGGYLGLPRLNAGAYDRVFLTLYVAAADGSGFRPMQQDGLTLEGSTDDTNYYNIPFGITAESGWQIIESEFRMAAGSNFYLRVSNPGTHNIYVDDITLETGGRGTQVIGDPAPTVTTIAAGEVTTGSATIGGSYTLPAGIGSVDKAGLMWKHADAVDYTEIEAAATQPAVAFSETLTGLTPGERYLFRAFTVHNGNVYSYGNELSFTTLNDDDEGGDDENDDE